MRKKVNRFTDEFKLKVVQEYLSTDMSQVELQEKYNFSGQSNISNWMRKFGLSYPEEAPQQIHQVMSKESSRTSREIELERRVIKLEAQLKEAALRTLALNTLIDVAERDLEIDIRKKSGAKR